MTRMKMEGGVAATDRTTKMTSSFESHPTKVGPPIPSVRVSPVVDENGSFAVPCTLIFLRSIGSRSSSLTVLSVPPLLPPMDEPWCIDDIDLILSAAVNSLANF